MSKKLYNLIKSLSPNEKGYFKKISSMHIIGTENIYMKLFEALSVMDGYDKSLLPIFFKKRRMENQLPAYTNYLFTNILDALKTYHARKTIYSEIKHLLLDFEILLAKGLLPEAEKILTKARKKANRTENLFLMIEIINWEETLAKTNTNVQALEHVINTSHLERLEITEKITTSIKYKWLHSRVIHLIQQMGQHIIGREELKKLEEIMKHPLLSDVSKATAITDKNTFYYIHALYNIIKLKPDVKISIEFTHRRKELMEQNIDWAWNDIGAYLSTFNNLLASYIQTFNIVEYDKLVEDLKKMPERFGNKLTEKLENTRLALINTAFLTRCFLNAEFEKGLSDIRGKEAQWEKVQSKVGKIETLVFYDHMRSLLFAVQDYKKALLWNNKILNDKSAKPDINLIARIWNIIIHYDMGNYGLTQTLIKSTIRTLDFENKSHGFEEFFLNNMQKILKSVTNKDNSTKNQFFAFKKELINLKRRSGEMLELDYITYMAWLDSHIEQKKFSEVIKKYLTPMS